MITIILDNKGDIYPGQTLKGKIELVPDSQIYVNDIELTFFCIEEWNYSKSENKTDKATYKKCISIKDLGINKYLPEGENNLIRLDPILHLFPFEIKLPNLLYPSIEYPKNNCKAYLRYYLLAKLESPNTELSTSKLIFVYCPSKRDNSNFFEEKIFGVKKWGMFGKGSTKVKASLFMKCFRFSDDIPINIEIDNINGKMKVNLVKINLVRKITLKDNNDFKVKYSYNDKAMKKVYKVEVKSGKKEVYDFKFPLKEIFHKEFSFFDNANLYNWNKSYSEFIPSIESNILSCQYLLKITLYFDSFLKKADRPRVFLPIFLVHKIENNNNVIPNNENITINPNKGAVETNEDEIRKQKESDFVIMDNNNLNNNQMYAKPMSAKKNVDRSKTINNNNSYIDNMANKYKEINQNPNRIFETPMSSHQNQINENNNNNIQDNKAKENNNNFNSRAKTLIENNNNIINDNNIENQDQEDAPSIQFYNNLKNKDINADDNNKKNKDN